MNVTNSNSSTPILDHRLKLVEQIVLATMFIVAVLGNGFVLIFVMIKRCRPLTRMSFFILHLTIADLLVAFFSVLPMLIWKSTTTFLGGDILCRIVAYLMLAVTYISVYTLVVMALDRYQAITHPLNSYDWTTNHGLLQMFCVWCLSLILASPQLFIFRFADHPSHGKKTCLAKFLGQDRTWEMVYIFWTIFLQFIVPVGFLIYYYSSIYLTVNRNLSLYSSTEHMATSYLKPNLSTTAKSSIRQNLAPNKDLQSPSFTGQNQSMYPLVYDVRQFRSSILSRLDPCESDKRKSRQYYVTNNFLNRARLKTIKLLFIVVLTYILCSTPFYIGSILMTLHGKFMSQKAMNWLMTIFSLLFNLNSCSNPIICLAMSRAPVRSSNDQNGRLACSYKSPEYCCQKTKKKRAEDDIL